MPRAEKRYAATLTSFDATKRRKGASRAVAEEGGAGPLSSHCPRNAAKGEDGRRRILKRARRESSENKVDFDWEGATASQNRNRIRGRRPKGGRRRYPNQHQSKIVLEDGEATENRLF